MVDTYTFSGTLGEKSHPFVSISRIISFEILDLRSCKCGYVVWGAVPDLGHVWVMRITLDMWAWGFCGPLVKMYALSR